MMKIFYLTPNNVFQKSFVKPEAKNAHQTLLKKDERDAPRVEKDKRPMFYGGYVLVREI